MTIFLNHNKARYGEERRPALYSFPIFFNRNLQKILWAEAEDGHKIICKWADLESSGKLNEMNETPIEGEFCKEIFGDVLVMTFFADNKENWNFQPKFTVNGGRGRCGNRNIWFKIKPECPCRNRTKRANLNLDKDRSAGQRLFSNAGIILIILHDCPWGIVSNYVSFRIFHRNQTPRVYELFTLQDLRKKMFSFNSIIFSEKADF